jgi:hypothetical protein
MRDASEVPTSRRRRRHDYGAIEYLALHLGGKVVDLSSSVAGMGEALKRNGMRLTDRDRNEENSNIEPLAKVRSSASEAKRFFLRAFMLAKDAVHPSALGSFEDWSSTVRGALFRSRFGRASLRAFMLAKDAVHPSALGSFEDWSSTVRGALFRLAHPVETTEFVRTSDPNLEELAMVLAFWEEALGTERTSVAEIIKTANTEKLGYYIYGDFRDALLAVAGVRGAISPSRLGRWLASNKERIAEGRRICRDEDVDKVSHWRLELKKKG